MPYKNGSVWLLSCFGSSNSSVWYLIDYEIRVNKVFPFHLYPVTHWQHRWEFWWWMRSLLIDCSAVSAGPHTLVTHGWHKHNLCLGVTLLHVKIINTRQTNLKSVSMNHKCVSVHPSVMWHPWWWALWQIEWVWNISGYLPWGYPLIGLDKVPLLMETEQHSEYLFNSCLLWSPVYSWCFKALFWCN